MTGMKIIRLLKKSFVGRYVRKATRKSSNSLTGRTTKRFNVREIYTRFNKIIGNLHIASGNAFPTKSVSRSLLCILFIQIMRFWARPLPTVCILIPQTEGKLGWVTLVVHQRAQSTPVSKRKTLETQRVGSALSKIKTVPHTEQQCVWLETILAAIPSTFTNCLGSERY